MNRVPHCSECDRCISTEYAYTSFYCCEENEKSKIYALLSVGHPPKTSPKWCPKRIGKTEDTIRMKTDLVLTDKIGNVIEVKSLQPEYILDSLS